MIIHAVHQNVVEWWEFPLLAVHPLCSPATLSWVGLSHASGLWCERNLSKIGAGHRVMLRPFYFFVTGPLLFWDLFEWKWVKDGKKSHLMAFKKILQLIKLLSTLVMVEQIGAGAEQAEVVLSLIDCGWWRCLGQIFKYKGDQTYLGDR